MPEPRFPTRYRDGFSIEAAGYAAFMHRSPGGDWQKKRTPDQEWEVSRDGLFVNVRHKRQRLTRLYLLGYLTTGEEWVFGSVNGREWFKVGPAGSAATQDDARQFLASSTGGVAYALTYGDGVNDFVGYTTAGLSINFIDAYALRWWLDKVAIAVTRNGTNGSFGYQVLDIENVRPSFIHYATEPTVPEYVDHYIQEPVSNKRGAVRVLPPGYLEDGGAPRWYAGVSHLKMDGDQAVNAFTCIRYAPGTTPPEWETSEGAPVVVPDGYPLGTTLCTLAPGRILKVDTFLYPLKFVPNTDHDDDEPIDPDKAGWEDMPKKPMAIVSQSTDGGATWAAVSAPIMAAELADLEATLTGYSYYAVSHHALDQDSVVFLSYDPTLQPVNVWSAPLSRTLSVVVVEVPYPTSATHWHWRVKLGTVGTDGVMAATSTLDEGTSTYFGAVLIKQLLALEGEVLLVRRSATDAYNTPATIYSTTDGATLALRGTLPAPEFRCGPIMAISPRTLAVTVYDENTATLWRSTDKGETWEEWGLIGDDLMEQPPAHLPAHLAEMAAVEVNGVLQSAYPATPWLTDCRIAHD